MRRRRLLALPAVLAMGLTLAACAGSDANVTDGGEESANPPATTADDADPAAETGAFPVTIDGALGEVTIEERPTRVVTLGWGTDIAYSLGTLPVGIEKDAWGGDADGYQPWFREAVEAAGEQLPAVISNDGEYDVDAIVALEPDLVLAPQSGLTQDQYDQLSAFTNVVAYPDGPWLTPINEQIEISAQALGVPEKAQELIDGMEGVVAAAAAANPEFADTTFTYVYLGPEAGTLEIYPQGDARVDLLTGMGLVPAPSWADYTPSEASFTKSLGLENADQLSDSDIIITWFNDDAERAAAEAQPLWQSIPAVQKGASYAVMDRALGMATGVATPLSVPWAIDAYVPVLQELVTTAHATD